MIFKPHIYWHVRRREEMNKPQAIVMKPSDNVATATQEISAGIDVVVNVAGTIVTVQVTEIIPFGHKFALKKISRGEKIIKYGEVIGEATVDINPGRHTHVHNLGGCRGRGDKQRARLLGALSREPSF